MRKAYLQSFELCPLFSGITGDELNSIVTSFSVVNTYSKGETVFSEKEYVRGLVIIIKGSASVTKADVLINILKKGDVFGMATLFFEEENYLTDITAKEELTVAFISKENVKKMFALYSVITENYITILSGKIHFLNSKISTYTKSESVQKVASLILEHTNAEKGECVLPFSLTLAAKSLNMGRASFYRAIESLEKDNIIKREGKKILITDLCKLKSI